MQKYFDEIVQTTVEILKFDSSMKPAEEGCPFGKEAADCLQYFLSLAEEMGFETRNYDNYVGEVVFGSGAVDDLAGIFRQNHVGLGGLGGGGDEQTVILAAQAHALPHHVAGGGGDYL